MTWTRNGNEIYNFVSEQGAANEVTPKCDETPPTTSLESSVSEKQVLLKTN